MKVILIVWAMFGPPDARLGQYEWYATQAQFPTMAACEAAANKTETSLVSRVDFRAMVLECREIDTVISIQ